MEKIQRKSMTLKDLAMYIKDLHRMGFVSESLEGDRLCYKLTDLGKKSGLEDLPIMISKKK